MHFQDFVRHFQAIFIINQQEKQCFVIAFFKYATSFAIVNKPLIKMAIKNIVAARTNRNVYFQ